MFSRDVFSIIGTVATFYYIQFRGLYNWTEMAKVLGSMTVAKTAKQTINYLSSQRPTLTLQISRPTSRTTTGFVELSLKLLSANTLSWLWRSPMPANWDLPACDTPSTISADTYDLLRTWLFSPTYLHWFLLFHDKKSNYSEPALQPRVYNGSMLPASNSWCGPYSWHGWASFFLVGGSHHILRILTILHLSPLYTYLVLFRTGHLSP